MFKFVAKLSIVFFLPVTVLFADPIPVHLEDVPVREVVNWYSAETGQAIAVDPRIKEGTLTVYGAMVEPEELPDFFKGVLRAHGYDLIGVSPAVVVPLSAGTSMPSVPASVMSGLPPLASSPGQGFIAQIDVPVVPSSTSILHFDNVRASDLTEVAKHFLSSGDQATTYAPTVSVLDSSNSLLVTGPEDQVEALQSYRSALDVAHPQVFIKALFYEIAEGDSLDLGLAYGRPDPGAANSSSNVAWAFNGGALSRGIAGSGAAFGILDGDVLSVAASAIARSSSARLLSSPQILALSGRPGQIIVGQNVPVITGRSTGEAASTDSPFQTIERRDVGLSLDVNPVVLSNGSIVLDVTANSDSLSDSTIASDVITNQRRVKTTVQLQSGQTLMLGGLISDDSSENQSGVPLLKDLPLVGGLFRTTSTGGERRTLHVLLQATVLASY